MHLKENSPTSTQKVRQTGVVKMVLVKLSKQFSVVRSILHQQVLIIGHSRIDIPHAVVENHNAIDDGFGNVLRKTVTV